MLQEPKSVQPRVIIKILLVIYLWKIVLEWNNIRRVWILESAIMLAIPVYLPNRSFKSPAISDRKCKVAIIGVKSAFIRNSIVPMPN